jgi:hypothetical protein
LERFTANASSGSSRASAVMGTLTIALGPLRLSVTVPDAATKSAGTVAVSTAVVQSTERAQHACGLGLAFIVKLAVPALSETLTSATVTEGGLGAALDELGSMEMSTAAAAATEMIRVQERRARCAVGRFMPKASAFRGA